MLRYNIKVTKDNIAREAMSWGEKFLSQDLSYVSGVTSPSYHLEKYDMLSASNDIISSDATLKLESENVSREGYCLILGKEYSVKEVNANGNVARYIEVNGTFYYEVGGKYIIDEMLVQGNDKKSVVTKEVIVDGGKNSVKIDTIAWIEDGNVTIDGIEYAYDKNERKITLDGSSFISDYSKVTKCDGIEFFNLASVNEVTKFKLTKAYEEIPYNFSKISYCSYIYFINLNGESYNVGFDKNDKDGSFSFFCEMNGENAPLFFKVGDDFIELNSSNLSLNGISEVYDYDSLKSITSYVRVTCDGEEKYLEVEHDVINSNDGDRVLVQLSDLYTSFGIGDVVTFHENSSNAALNVHEDESEFVVYNGNKIDLVKNLCDTVTIGDYEYSLHYPNGRTIGKDCIVDVANSKVQMQLIESNGAMAVKPYGYVVVNGEKVATNNVSYKINEYDGVTINGVDYKRYKSDSENVITTDLGLKYIFDIDDIVGSSIIVCKAFIPTEGMSKDMYVKIGKEILQSAIDNSASLSMTSVNKIFGVREITPSLPYYKKSSMYEDVASSKYYYDLFGNLIIYCNIGYVSVKFPIVMDVGGDTSQDDIVENDFFEHEKNLAINPIIDMEKDVYCPKYIDGKYNGSDTTFKPISEIRVNLHFRTRDLGTWKVNEGFNIKDTSGATDGWFVTDYYPYKDMSKKTLMELSDLVGLLNFTNDDIYYQKSKIGKSFLRFSYYDSIDPNNQLLLATSTVFMDEHALFKKFIDNSRKNVNTYSLVSYDKDKVKDLNKISVMTELKRNGSVTVSDEGNRLGSRFAITNKYDTDTSSEGFYIYMFKEYSENLHPREIFMKVEFNHAGIGATIPFIKPMSWKEDPTLHIQYPSSELAVGSVGMMQGVELEKKNAQDYIPLYAVYDFKNKEYSYVFDKRYVSVDDGVASLNLFELKLKDESGDSTSSANDVKKYGIDSIF